MIKVEDIEKDGKEGISCRIEGCAVDLAANLDALFEAFSKNETLEKVLLCSIENYITSRSTEILNEKGDK